MTTVAASADIGVTGLGVMGRNLARHGLAVAVHNRSPERTRSLLDQHGKEGTFVPSGSLAGLVASLKRPRAVIVMVQAGGATDAVIEELAGLLEPGDVIADCGNAHFADTRRREAAMAARGLHLAGVGVSGGEEGALNGPSVMAGGSAGAWEVLGPALTAVAARAGGAPCAARLGPGGAGHFVKMVHNGIEYADMQLIGEAYDLLRHGLEVPARELAAVFRRWNGGDLESFLIEITADVLGEDDDETGKALVDVILDQAGQKGHWPLDGTGRPRPWRPGRRHRRGRVRPVAVRPRRAAGRGQGDVRHVSRLPGRQRSSRAGGGCPQGPVRLQGHRLRLGLRPDQGRGGRVRRARERALRRGRQRRRARPDRDRPCSTWSPAATPRQRQPSSPPSQRAGGPDEVAEAIRYITSPRAAYPAGQTIFLDGGMTAA